jgi:hypothetical protein
MRYARAYTSGSWVMIHLSLGSIHCGETIPPEYRSTGLAVSVTWRASRVARSSIQSKAGRMGSPAWSKATTVHDVHA